MLEAVYWNHDFWMIELSHDRQSTRRLGVIAVRVTLGPFVFVMCRRIKIPYLKYLAYLNAKDVRVEPATALI